MSLMPKQSQNRLNNRQIKMSTSGIRKSKIGWTPQEENYLEILCSGNRKYDWKTISCQLNSKFIDKCRSSKQCRQRFHNYIKYREESTQSCPWTEEQDQLLFRMYVQVGSKWSQMSKNILGRSENNIKNRFYGKLRKFVRLINEAHKSNSLKNRKPIKQQMIIKILSRPELKISSKIIYNSKIIEPSLFLEKLKYDLLTIILNYQIQVGQQTVAEILSRIYLYSSITKSQNILQNRLGKIAKRKRLPPFKKTQKNDSQIIQCPRQSGQARNISMGPKEQISQRKIQEKQCTRQLFEIEDLSDIEIEIQNLINCKGKLAFNKEISDGLSFLDDKCVSQNYDYFQFN